MRIGDDGPVRGVEMRIALLGLTGDEPSIGAWQIALRRTGAAFDTFALTRPRHRRWLIDALRAARIQAVIVDGTHVLDETLSSGQRSAFDELAAAHACRRLIADAYPGPRLGLHPPPWAGPLDGLSATVTATGRRVFKYLTGQLAMQAGSWGYPSLPISSARFDTLLAMPDGAALLGIHRRADGGEEMIQAFAANAEQSHAQLLRPGQLRWITRGTHLGCERHFLALHVDDVLLANHSWNEVTHASDTVQGTAARMTAGDAQRAADWSRSRGLRLDLACNGSGHARHATLGGDRLLSALLRERDTFGWLNHTYEHLDLDRLPFAAVCAEIERNVDWARRVGAPLETGSLVTGAHTGLANLAAAPPRPENPALAAALQARGISVIACDASRPYRNRAGTVTEPGEPFSVGSALAVARHPSRLPFDAMTPAQAMDRLRCTGVVDRSSTWKQIVSAEATRIFNAMLSNDPRPHYAHQSNLIGGDALLYQLVDAVLRRHRAAVTATMPIVAPAFAEIGEWTRNWLAFRAALGVGAISAYTDGATVTIVNRTTAAVAVPLTGVRAGALYGGARSAWLPANPGETALAVDT
ncbi:MAG: hypothetical protein ABSH51_06150 [Solirubrobacteraceae bacterium]